MDLDDPTTVALIAADAFESARLDYALYGGLLTAVYGEPRETRDADLAVTDVKADRALAALLAQRVESVVAFADVQFGGLVLDRLTLLGSDTSTGLNTIDLVRPRSRRYASLAVERSVRTLLRGRAVRVLTLEDYILFKVLSTRTRDVEDAQAALRRSGALLDRTLVESEVAVLTDELPDVDVRGRWAQVAAPE